MANNGSLDTQEESENSQSLVLLRLRQVLPKLPIEREWDLIRQLSLPWRRYHNLSHVLSMLEVAEAVYRDICTPTEWRILVVDIIYHDAFYKLAQEPGWNESESRWWAVEDCVAAGIDCQNFLQSVQYGILATENHQLVSVPKLQQRNVARLLDLDLKGLGAEPHLFARDTELIWEEYEPIATRTQFNKGRSDWAKRFLFRKRIYHTPELEHLERQARSNLKSLILL